MSLLSTPEVERLVAAARDAANRGGWRDAERLWEEVLARDPANPSALYSLGVHAMQRRDLPRAIDMLERACITSPADALARLTLGAVRRQAGDDAGEMAEIDAALAIDAYFLPALLAKAQWYRRQGQDVMAANYYRYAVKFAPPEPHWPQELRAQLAHAREVADRHAASVEATLLEAMQPASSGLTPVDAERWREAASIMAGRSAPYSQHCNQLHVPRLPAVPFFDTKQFPWVAALEARTEAIRSELLAVLDSMRDSFKPYVAYAPSMPVNQWKELNHSDRWSAFSLWRAGKRVEENLALCPETAKALEQVGMAEIEGLCPNVMFSALAPRTSIPPHTGETNARIVAHLPLVVPDGCRYRVGFEHRRWQVGKVLVFDDTIEHEAHNDSDELRVVLIFDIWNPLLSPAERSIVRTMMDEIRRLQQPEPRS